MVFPLDIIATVFNFLDWRSLLKVSTTCKTWRNLIFKTNIDVWERSEIDFESVKLKHCFLKFLANKRLLVRILKVKHPPILYFTEYCVQIKSLTLTSEECDSLCMTSIPNRKLQTEDNTLHFNCEELCIKVTQDKCHWSPVRDLRVIFPQTIRTAIIYTDSIITPNGAPGTKTRHFSFDYNGPFKNVTPSSSFIFRPSEYLAVFGVNQVGHLCFLFRGSKCDAVLSHDIKNDEDLIKIGCIKL